jgi:hypothetical protein
MPALPPDPQAAARHGPHVPAVTAPGAFHLNASIHVNSHGASGRAMWAGGPAAIAALASGGHSGGVPGTEKFVRW